MIGWMVLGLALAVAAITAAELSPRWLAYRRRRRYLRAMRGLTEGFASIAQQIAEEMAPVLREAARAMQEMAEEVADFYADLPADWAE